MKNTLPRNSVIADTGFWLALANPRDRHHQAAKKALRRYESLVLVVTWPVISEAAYLISHRVSWHAQMLFLQGIERGGADIFHLHEPEYWQRMRKVLLKYRDLPMDLADASLVILAEELGHGRILSTDRRDFQTYRWNNHEPFENLLLPDE